MKIFSLQWPIIITTTIILYMLVIITLPFSVTFPTIFLFAIIGYWTRLPGVGIPHPFFILYQADLIDIFTLIIAIHVSPVHAIVYTVFCNLGSRLVGIFPKFEGVCHDAIIQSVIALIAPFLYAMTGNIITVVGIYSVLRIIGFIIMGFIWPIRSIPTLLIQEAGAGVAVFFINMFYVKLFGSFFENLLMQGVAFNWMLFIIVSAAILIITITVFGFSPAAFGRKVAKNVAKKMLVKEDKTNIKNNDVEDFRIINENL